MVCFEFSHSYITLNRVWEVNGRDGGRLTGEGVLEDRCRGRVSRDYILSRISFLIDRW